MIEWLLTGDNLLNICMKIGIISFSISNILIIIRLFSKWDSVKDKRNKNIIVLLFLNSLLFIGGYFFISGYIIRDEYIKGSEWKEVYSNGIGAEVKLEIYDKDNSLSINKEANKSINKKDYDEKIKDILVYNFITNGKGFKIEDKDGKKEYLLYSKLYGGKDLGNNYNIFKDNRLEGLIYAKKDEDIEKRSIIIEKDNIIINRELDTKARISKIEYRKIEGIKKKAFGYYSKDIRPYNKDGELRITIEGQKENQLKDLFDK